VVTPDRPLRIALLSYRSKPHCGGQGVYIRHLSRELDALGHQVEVFSGQPYPDLDPGPRLTRIPSLDLYRDDDPLRTPRWHELRDWADALETVMMWSGAFPEPLTFSIRALRALTARAEEFDVVHDNQGLGYGMLAVRRLGLPLVTSIHHPISVDRRIELAGLHGLDRLSRRRWYGFVRMQARVARRVAGRGPGPGRGCRLSKYGLGCGVELPAAGGGKSPKPIFIRIHREEFPGPGTGVTEYVRISPGGASG
jgi:glycosyltransferase involved in cell wall biosynthesis